jgi:hypothetical protein
MKRFATLTIALIAGLAVVQPSVAHQRDGCNLNRIAKHQKHEIREGVLKGDLTRREAQRLYQQQRRIKQLKRELREDGSLSRDDRRQLRQAYRKAERRIDHLRSNDRRRYTYRDKTRHHHKYDYPRYSSGYWNSSVFNYNDDDRDGNIFWY